MQVEQLLSASQKLTPKSFTATVLSLVQHRAMKFLRSDEKEGWPFAKYTYYLQVQKNSRTPLNSFEQDVFEFLVDAIGEVTKTIGGQSQSVIPLDSIVQTSNNHAHPTHRFYLKFEHTLLQK